MKRRNAGVVPVTVAGQLTNQLVSEYVLDGLAVSVDFIVENDLLYLEIKIATEAQSSQR